MARVRIFLGSDPGAKVNDRVKLYATTGTYLRTIQVDGPAFDHSGQSGGFFGFAVAYELTGQEIQ